MAEKKKKVRVKRLYEYARDYTVFPDGKVRYHGLLYEYEEPDCAPRLRRCLLSSAIAAAFMVLSGLLPVVSMRFSPFVIFPYGIALVVSAVLLVSCVRAVRAEVPMQRRTYDTSSGRFLPVSAVLGVCAAVCFAGHLVYVLTHLFLGVTAPDVIFAVAQGCAAALAVSVALQSRKLRCRSFEA